MRITNTGVPKHLYPSSVNKPVSGELLDFVQRETDSVQMLLFGEAGEKEKGCRDLVLKHLLLKGIGTTVCPLWLIHCPAQSLLVLAISTSVFRGKNPEVFTAGAY